MDYPMLCETLVRKIFQCGRFDDPIGRLANTDQWDFSNPDQLDQELKCKAWVVICRIINQYLDSIPGREELFSQAERLEEKILVASTNAEILDVMLVLNDLVNALGISEFPHLSYNCTNDNLN